MFVLQRSINFVLQRSINRRRAAAELACEQLGFRQARLATSQDVAQDAGY
jgi:hypothetical protein